MPGIRYKRSRLPGLFVSMYIVDGGPSHSTEIRECSHAPRTASLLVDVRRVLRTRMLCAITDDIPRFPGRLHATCHDPGQSMHAYTSVANPRDTGFGYVQDRSTQSFVQDVCHQFQPCTSAQTNPTPGLILTQTSGGSRSAGAVARLRRVLRRCLKKNRAAGIPALTNKTRILSKVSHPRQISSR